MRYLIKLGGSLITDKSRPLTPRPEAIERIAAELGSLYKQLPDATWVIGTGAGSYGHYTVKEVSYFDDPSDPIRIAAVHNSSEALCKLVIDALVKAGIPAALLSPFQHITQTKKGLSADLSCLEQMQAAGIVPVVHGDIILDDLGSSRILATEESLHVIGQRADDSMVVYTTAVDGVLDEHGTVIPFFDPAMSLHKHDDKSIDVTGGMAQKVSAGFQALTYAGRVYIINGLRQGALTDAVHLRDVGTQLIKAQGPHRPDRLL